MTRFPRQSSRSFTNSGVIGIAFVLGFVVTGKAYLAGMGFLIIGATNIYDVATRWREPLSTPRFRNVTLPGISRVSPRFELLMESTAGVVFFVLGTYIISRVG